MSTVFRLFVTLLCTAFVLVLDGTMANGIWRQFGSSHYPAITGRITVSEIRSHRGRHGTNYSPYIAYTYQVGLQIFSGARLRYTLLFSSSYGTTKEIVDAYPPGSTATIYYNPADPSDSSLSSGIRGMDFLGIFLATPFNMLMLGLWAWSYGWLRERWFKPLAGGVKIFADGPLTRVRLPRTVALWWGLGTTGVLGLVSVFAVTVDRQLGEPVGFVLSAIGIVYLAGVAVYGFLWLKAQSGVYDLVIDEPGRTVSLPPTFGREERLTVDVAGVKKIQVKKVEHRGSKGGITYTYAPTLSLLPTENGDQKLADWPDKLKADDFSRWLSEKLGVLVDLQPED